VIGLLHDPVQAGQGRAVVPPSIIACLSLLEWRAGQRGRRLGSAGWASLAGNKFGAEPGYCRLVRFNPTPSWAAAFLKGVPLIAPKAALQLVQPGVGSFVIATQGWHRSTIGCERKAILE